MIDTCDETKSTSNSNDTAEPKPSTNPKVEPFPTKIVGEMKEPLQTPQPLSEDRRGNE